MQLSDVRGSAHRWGAGDAASLLLIVACAAVIGWMAASRTFLHITTETDFIGTFWPEARRLLDGEAMRIDFHPPGYPIVLAFIHSIVDDAMQSGLLISWISAVVALVASYLFYRRLGGPLAALGAVAAMAASTPFLMFSAMATSDAFFFAIWTVGLATSAYALDSGRRLHWVIAGFIVGSVILSRTNGIVMAMIALLPFLAGDPWQRSLRNAGFVLLGIVIPVGVWAVCSAQLGSPIMPTRNFANLALTYYSPGSRINGDELRELERQFDSLWDVLTYDPARILRTYAQDLWQLPRLLLVEITWVPFSIIGFVGILLWLRRWKDAHVVLALLPALGGVLFLNLKAYEPRYYFFLIPLIGAAAGYALQAGLRRIYDSGRWAAPAIALTATGCLAVAGSIAMTSVEHPSVAAQFAEAVPLAQQQTAADSAIVARKENVAFHAGRPSVWLPDLQSPQALCAFLADQEQASAVHLFVGLAERDLRPELVAWLDRERPSWLEVRIAGSAGGGWRLLTWTPDTDCTQVRGSFAPAA